MIEQNPPIDPNAPVEEAPKNVVVDVPEKPTEEQPNMLERAGQAIGDMYDRSVLKNEVVDPAVEAVEGAVEAVDETLADVFEATPQSVAKVAPVIEDIITKGPRQAAVESLQKGEDESYEKQVQIDRNNAITMSRFNSQDDFHRELIEPNTIINGEFKIGDVVNKFNPNQHILAQKYYYEFFAPEDQRVDYGLRANKDELVLAQNAYDTMISTFFDTRQKFVEKNSGNRVAFVDPETNELYEEYPEFVSQYFNLKTSYGEAAEFSRQLSDFVGTKIRPDNSEQSALIADALALRFAGGDPIVEGGRTAGQIAIDTASFLYETFEMSTNYTNPFKVYEVFVPRIKALLNKEGTDFDTEGALLQKDMEAKAREISQNVNEFIQSSDFLSFQNTLNNKIREHTISVRGEEYYDAYKDSLTLSEEEVERIMKFSTNSTTLGKAASYAVEGVATLTALNKATKLRERSLKEAIGVERAALRESYRSLPYRDVVKQITQSKVAELRSRNPIISTIYKLTMPESRAESRMNLGLSLMQNAKIPRSMSKKIDELSDQRARLSVQSGTSDAIKQIDKQLDEAYQGVLKYALKNSAKGSGMDPLLRRSLLEETGAAYTGALFLTATGLNQSENADLYAMLPMVLSNVAIGYGLDVADFVSGGAVIGPIRNRIRRDMTYIDPEGEYAIPEELLLGIEKPTANFPFDYRKADGSLLNKTEIEGVQEMMRGLKKLSPVAREMMVRGMKDSLRQQKNILAPFDAEIEDLQRIVQSPDSITGMSPEQARQRITQVTQFRQQAKEGLETVLGNMSGVMAFSGYVNDRLSKSSLSVGDLRSYGDDLTKMVKKQVQAEETVRGISSLIESLSSLTVTGSVTGKFQDLDRIRKETLEVLSTDRRALEQQIEADKEAIKQAVESHTEVAEDLFREGSIDIDVFEEALGVRFENMAVESARGAQTAQEALDTFRASREEYFQQANSRLAESGINLKDVLNDPDVTPGILGNAVDSRMLDVFETVHSRQLADNALIYAPLQEFDDVDVGGALKDVVLQFTKFDRDPMRVFTPDMTGDVGTPRKMKRALNTAITQSVVDYFKGVTREVKGTDDPDQVRDVLEAALEEYGDDIASFIREQTGRTNFTKNEINPSHMYAFIIGKGESIPVKVSFEQLDTLRRQLKREVTQYKGDRQRVQFEALQTTYENLDSYLRQAGDAIVIDEATGKTVTNHLDQQAFRYEIEHSNRYDGSWDGVPSFRGEIRDFVKKNRERVGVGPTQLHNTVFGDRFVTRLAGKTVAERDKADRELQQILDKGFGKATIRDATSGKYVDLDTYLANNPDVTQEGVQTLIDQGRIRYSLDDLSDAEFEEIRPQLTAVMNALFVDSFGTAIDMGEKKTGKALRDQFKDPKKSWLFDLSDRLKEDGPRVLEEMKEAFSVQRNGETVYLLDPIDKVTATVEDVASVVRDIGNRSQVDEYARKTFRDTMASALFKELQQADQQSAKYRETFKNTMNMKSFFDSDDVVNQVNSLIEYYVAIDGGANREFIVKGLRSFFVEHILKEKGGMTNTTLKEVNRLGKDAPSKHLKNPEDMLDYLNSDTASDLFRALDMDEEHMLAIRDLGGFLMDMKNAQQSGVSMRDQYSPMSVASKASRTHNVIRGIVHPSYYVLEAGFNLMRKRNMDFMDFMFTDKEGAKLAIAMIADPANIPTEDYKLLGQRIIAYALSFGTGQRDSTLDLNVLQQDAMDTYTRMSGLTEEDEQQ